MLEATIQVGSQSKQPPITQPPTHKQQQQRMNQSARSLKKKVVTMKNFLAVTVRQLIITARAQHAAVVVVRVQLFNVVVIHVPVRGAPLCGNATL
jgi:hypothetical protein